MFLIIPIVAQVKEGQIYTDLPSRLPLPRLFGYVVVPRFIYVAPFHGCALCVCVCCCCYVTTVAFGGVLFLLRFGLHVVIWLFPGYRWLPILLCYSIYCHLFIDLFICCWCDPVVVVVILLFYCCYYCLLTTPTPFLFGRPRPTATPYIPSQCPPPRWAFPRLLFVPPPRAGHRVYPGPTTGGERWNRSRVGGDRGRCGQTVTCQSIHPTNARLTLFPARRSSLLLVTPAGLPCCPHRIIRFRVYSRLPHV